MGISPAHIETRLSGGAANADPNLSIGGALSSERVVSQSSTAPVNVTGVAIAYASKNALGAGTLDYVATGDLITWAGNGAAAGTAVAITADDEYTLLDSLGGQVDIVVTFASLPVANQNDSITISNVANETFDDVAKTESFAGDIEYRCFYLTNTHPTESTIETKLFIDTQPNGADTLDIGLDPGGLGSTPATIADENTAPAGVTFTQPANAAAGLAIGVLAPAEFYPFWVRRSVPAATLVETLLDVSILGFEVTY